MLSSIVADDEGNISNDDTNDMLVQIDIAPAKLTMDHIKKVHFICDGHYRMTNVFNFGQLLLKEQTYW